MRLTAMKSMIGIKCKEKSLAAAGFSQTAMAKSQKTLTVKGITLKIGKKKVTEKTFPMQQGGEKENQSHGREEVVQWLRDSGIQELIVKSGEDIQEQALDFELTEEEIRQINALDQNEKMEEKIMKKNSIVWINLALVFALVTGLLFPVANVHAAGKQNKETKKVLIVYFSATGTTKGAAEKLQKATGGNLYRINPAKPYTTADLGYENDDCRANKEQNDENARPQIKGKVNNIRKYDVIFLGYPIWWGKEPKIIRTFLESYNLKGKKIVPFCTSGGSGISGSMKGVKASAKGAKVVKGKDLTDLSYKSAAKWAKQVK